MSDRNWVDARELMGHAEDEGALPPTAHFTYWKQNSASRIDRFYVSANWQQQVQWVDVQLPPVDSDHQAVTLHLSGQRKHPNKSQRRPSYPIRSTYPDKVLLDLLTEITRRGVGQRRGVQCWDESLNLISEAIANVSKREKQRRQRVTQRIQRQTRANLITRQQLIRAATDDLKAAAQIRLGANLDNTTEQIRLKFKRWSDWERDQSVTNIRAANGPDYPNTMPISDRFAIEWSTIQGQRHSDFTDSEQLRAALHDFVKIPEKRKVRPEDNYDLMREITTTEIATAIESLSRQKAVGEDGLNNDFYKDAGGILIPLLTKLSNDILQGAEPPESFRRAMIIPLRKKGDSEQAMDYRPIALLQTSYKVFTKVLAMRLQMFLGRLIGATQQGFVHGRQIQKTVAMMLATLQDAMEDINTQCP
ncbi:hypothetical protein PF005_g14691 [Phytophthora fragariae]|uniref:Reverse transcriptase domain-containing protein n=2 Tax=Phytophthora fragariae TaxID=53985 RepID=A0A6A3XMM8_9STRA|nr:hypothetical protein PF009_g16060 [Phytophthora fragariae]KAE9101583.1 hypothetical protein PF007_g15085 [Phytophthora fragariae]KAE9138543.1 hypothetical protein PF006_g13926 [Phytophthora fragariae]KAE9202112.1 hypothetical protein PF005_g14691 [Phytophthora fragariae]KAE9218143.1 hypothetical protein PF004_g13948 [Phytophthora fragariae]